MNATFEARPLLNKSEARVFKELDRIVISCNPGWQVMAQVSLGEILRCEDLTPIAASTRNGSICCLWTRPVCLAMQSSIKAARIIKEIAAARDAVKKEALRRAGIGYHEVVAGHTTPSDLRRLCEKLVDKPVAAQSLPEPDSALPAGVTAV